MNSKIKVKLRVWAYEQFLEPIEDFCDDFPRNIGNFFLGVLEGVGQLILALFMGIMVGCLFAILWPPLGLFVGIIVFLSALG